jgi:hypothetical protein
VTESRGFLRRNLFLVAAVALPALVVVFFLLASALPRWLVDPPAYDLVLRVGKPYVHPSPKVGVEFRVQDGALQAVVWPVAKESAEQPWMLFLYDHETMSLREVPVDLPASLPEDSERQIIPVKAFAGRRILPQLKAPDGYELQTQPYRGPGIVGDLFGMHRYDRSASLVNKGRVVPLPLPSGYEYLSSVYAIGWLQTEADK